MLSRQLVPVVVVGKLTTNCTTVIRIGFNFHLLSRTYPDTRVSDTPFCSKLLTYPGTPYPVATTFLPGYPGYYPGTVPGYSVPG